MKIKNETPEMFVPEMITRNEQPKIDPISIPDAMQILAYTEQEILDQVRLGTLRLYRIDGRLRMDRTAVELLKK